MIITCYRERRKNKIPEIPLSNKTISKTINNMSVDMLDQKSKKSKKQLYLF